MGFGEVALLSNGERTATMVTEEDTYCMTLSKQSFESIIKSYKEKFVKI